MTPPAAEAAQPAPAARRGRAARAVVAAAVLLALAAAWVLWRNVVGEESVLAHDGTALRHVDADADPTTLARGEYLARAGNCLGCHTARGGPPGAGGRAVATPFGTVFSSNLTPDDETGIGRWSASEFRRALRHGRSRDGRLLTPAFPYPSFALVTQEDADAIFAWLTSRPAVRQPNRPHELRFPYGLQASLAVWRALFFRPEPFAPDPTRSAAWNRGSYLVNGLGHCLACHSARNFLGAPAPSTQAGGAIVSAQHWYAPSLAELHEAGVADGPPEDVVALLGTGTSARGSAMGPMAEVVARSTQHLTASDLRAMAEYLRSAAGAAAGAAQGGPVATPAPAQVMARGRAIYTDHCAGCHGPQGEGTPGIGALAGRRALRLRTPHNVIQAIRHGGFLPATTGNPRPFGMPPFRGVLRDDEIAAVASYVRGAWGNDAGAVDAMDLWRAR